MTDVLVDGAGSATLLLAHGAGAPMDSAWMNAMTAALAGHDIEVVRFEFGYMAARRTGPRKPPPRAEALLDEYRAAVSAMDEGRAMFIGGKSLGGRVASMVAEDLYQAGRVAGLVCLGYPFHPPGRPEKLRTAHLAGLACPALICQGERDPFGTRDEVAGYALSPSIAIEWLPDGDHDLSPRKASGHTLAGHQAAAAARIAGWMAAASSAR